MMEGDGRVMEGEKAATSREMPKPKLVRCCRATRAEIDCPRPRVHAGMPVAEGRRTPQLQRRAQWAHSLSPSNPLTLYPL